MFHSLRTCSKDSDCARLQQTCEEDNRWSYAHGEARLVRACVTEQPWEQSVSLSSAEAEVHALTTGIAQGMVTKHLMKELGYDVTLVNHVDSQST